MNAAILSIRFSSGVIESLKQLVTEWQRYSGNIFLYKPLYDFIKQQNITIANIKGVFEKPDDISSHIDCFFSIGGDGTFLQSASFVGKKGIPIIGINAGRLGFLANITRHEIKESVDAIVKKEYDLEYRSLIKLDSPSGINDVFPFALNDVTLQKKGSSLITIHTFINEEYLNGYWTDGLIISTPTGSTAYSMSVGGPIVCPDCKNFIISPIASHNLSVRPLIIDYNSIITMQVESRNCRFLLTLDSITTELDTSVKIQLRKADFEIPTIKLKHHSFYNTIRQKLMWGIDPRN